MKIITIVTSVELQKRYAFISHYPNVDQEFKKKLCDSI